MGPIKWKKIKTIGLKYEFKMRQLYVQILFEFYLMNIPLLVKKDQYFFFLNEMYQNKESSKLVTSLTSPTTD